MNNSSDQQPDPAALFSRWARPFALASAVVFLISLAFPVTATLFTDTSVFPKWVGVVDVVLAFVIVILAFVLYGLAHSQVNKQIEEITYRAYRILIHGIFVLILIFFLFRERVIWINGLLGIAWRAWLLLYILPEWFTVIRAPSKAVSH